MGKASSAALQRLAREARFLGTALPGFPGIRPPWGRPLPSPPPIHSMVPGGGLAQERAAWWPARANCSVPVKALSPLSRALFQAELPTAGRVEQSAPQVWHTPWHVPSQVNPHGATSWQSLAPSGCTVALANRRLVALQDPIGTCTSRKPGSARPRTTQRDVRAFLRRFLQHGLPSGFMKVRHGGFMRASGAINTSAIRRMMAETNDATPAPPATPDAPSPPCSCPHWGGALRGSMRGLPSQEALVDTGCDEDSWTDASVQPCAGKGQGRVRPGGGIGVLGALERRRPRATPGVENAQGLSRGLAPGDARPRSSRCGAHTAPPLRSHPLADIWAFTQGFLEHRIEVTAADHLNP
jgi:Putative transposase